MRRFTAAVRTFYARLKEVTSSHRRVPPRPAEGDRHQRISLAACVVVVLAAAAQPLSFVSAMADDVGKPAGLALDTYEGTTFLYVSDHAAGAYTAVVRGAPGDTGVALVEVFELPAP